MHCLSSPILSLHYLPKTPSPLRTSRNANLMPPPPTPTHKDDEVKSSPLSSRSSNYFSPAQQAADENELSSPPTPLETFGLGSRAGSMFRFEQRARSTSPRVELASYTRGKREERKGRVLERIRVRRDEGRFEGRNEQVLRMDFVRERRLWEEQLRKRADVEGVGGDEEMGMEEIERGLEGMMEMGRDEEHVGALSPTEDKEIEELVSYLEHGEQIVGKGDSQARNDVSDDEEYDRLFMEMTGGDEEQILLSNQRDTGPLVKASNGISEDAEMDLS